MRYRNTLYILRQRTRLGDIGTQFKRMCTMDCTEVQKYCKRERIGLCFSTEGEVRPPVGAPMNRKYVQEVCKRTMGYFFQIKYSTQWRESTLLLCPIVGHKLKLKNNGLRATFLQIKYKREHCHTNGRKYISPLCPIVGHKLEGQEMPWAMWQMKHGVQTLTFTFWTFFVVYQVYKMVWIFCYVIFGNYSV